MDPALRSRVAALAVVTLALVVGAARAPRPRAAAPAASARGDHARPAAGTSAAAPLLFGGRLDLDTASAWDLQALPGIGPARARAIVTLRGRRGGRFQRTRELLDVPGIGPATYARIRGHVAVGREEP